MALWVVVAIGDIKAFFGTKPKPKEESKLPEPAPGKMEIRFSEKKQEPIGHGLANFPSRTLKTEEPSPTKSGFVLASTLDRKRFAASAPTPESPQTPKKRKLPAKPVARGQGTLDAFFHRK